MGGTVIGGIVIGETVEITIEDQFHHELFTKVSEQEAEIARLKAEIVKWSNLSCRLLVEQTNRRRLK